MRGGGCGGVRWGAVGWVRWGAVGPTRLAALLLLLAALWSASILTVRAVITPRSLCFPSRGVPSRGSTVIREQGELKARQDANLKGEIDAKLEGMGDLDAKGEKNLQDRAVAQEQLRCGC